MPDPIRSPTQAVNRFAVQFNAILHAQIKALLEQKHLYQKVSVDPVAIASSVLAASHVPVHIRDVSEREVARIIRGRLLLTSGQPVLATQGGVPIAALALVLPRIRLFCTPCDERQAFAPVWYADATDELLKATPHEQAGRTSGLDSTQLFFVAYQCQHCQGAPEGFLIRKDGSQFSLDGRSPMEEMQTPSYIPKKEKNFYRDAMIARFAGKQLAAVFYLRVFIEQFARRQTGMRDKRTGDEIMDAYGELLPADNRDSMPSLREWHRKLSGVIHSADEKAAEELFEGAREEIERHFDIRRVFRMPESHDQQRQPPKPTGKSPSTNAKKDS